MVEYHRCNMQSAKTDVQGMMGNVSFDRDIWVLKGKGKGQLSAEDKKRLEDSFHKKKAKRSNTHAGQPSGLAGSGEAASSGVASSQGGRPRLVPAAAAVQRGSTDFYGFGFGASPTDDPRPLEERRKESRELLAQHSGHIPDVYKKAAWAPLPDIWEKEVSHTRDYASHRV